MCSEPKDDEMRIRLGGVNAVKPGLRPGKRNVVVTLANAVGDYASTAPATASPKRSGFK